MSDLPTSIPGAGLDPSGLGMGGSAPPEKPLPRLKDLSEAQSLAPGDFFLDPSGTKRQRPYDVKTPLDVERLVPEGSHFRDPTGKVRLKPETEPLDIGAQVLYSMAGSDKARRQQALEYIYGRHAVKETPGGDFLVQDIDNKRWLKPGKGLLGPAVGAVAESIAPVVGSIGVGMLGASVGATEFGVGALPTAVLGAGSGAVAGEAFNDMILGLMGIKSSDDETRRRMTEAATLGMAGEGVGRAVGAVVPPALKAFTGLRKGVTEAATSGDILPRAARFVLGAEGPETLQALEMTRSGTLVRPSAFMLEAPYLKKVIEEFDPVFRQQQPLRQSAAEFYERKGGELAGKLGINRTTPLLSPTAAVEVEPLGIALKERLGDEVAVANDRLNQAIAARKAAAQASAAEAQTFKSTELSGLHTAENELRTTAQRIVDSGFSDVSKSVQDAMKAAGADQHPGALWTAAGDQLNKIHLGIETVSARGYNAGHAAAGPTPMALSPAVTEARTFLSTLPEGFESRFPALTKELETLSTPRGTGIVGLDGKEIMRVPDITLEQAHNLRNLARAQTNRDMPYNDLLEGRRKHLAGIVNKWMHDPSQPPAVKAGVDIIDRWDTWYAKNIGRFDQEAVQTIAKKMKAGFVDDAPALAKLVLDPNSTVNRENVKKLLGPTLWKAVHAADVSRVIESSRDALGKVDSTTFARQVLDRARTKLWDESDLGQRTIQLAKQVEAMAPKGRIPLDAMPGDTVASLLQRANTFAAEAKQAAAVDPIKLLNQETTRIEAERAAAQKEMTAEFRKSPLNFLTEPTVGAIEAGERILNSPDLTLAVAHRFGTDSPEFRMLRQAYAEKLLQVGGGEGVGRAANMLHTLQRIPESVQQIVFPGVTKDEALTLAKNMSFLLGGTGETFGGGIAAAQRVLNPVPELRHFSMEAAKVLSRVPGGNLAARLTIGKYYQIMTWAFTHPKFVEWLAQGLEKGPVERETARKAFWEASGLGRDIGGAVGAGVGVMNVDQAQPQGRRTARPTPALRPTGSSPADQTLRSIQ